MIKRPVKKSNKLSFINSILFIFIFTTIYIHVHVTNNVFHDDLFTTVAKLIKHIYTIIQYYNLCL